MSISVIWSKIGLLEGGSKIIANDSLQFFKLTQFKSLIALSELFNWSKTFKHLLGDPRAVSIINLRPLLVKYSKISGDSSKLPFHHNHEGNSSIDNSSTIFNPLLDIDAESPLITTKSPQIGCVTGVSLNGQ